MSVMLTTHRAASFGLFGPALLFALASWPSHAQTAPVVPGVITLSDSEKAEVLRHKEETGGDDALQAQAPQPSSAAAGQIHGEVGAMIGSNGARGAFGSASIPLGQDAGASVSFETSRYGRH
jgi:hypothetical protein